MKSIVKIAIIVPNWNGEKSIASCLSSLINQSGSLDYRIIVVENGSTDNSANIIKDFKDVVLLKQSKNLGFAGGVNKGIEYAIKKEFDYIALFNNDAIAEKDWLLNLVKGFKKDSKIGIVTSKIVDSKNKYIDSTGDFLTIWGLPFPRGRKEKISSKYDTQNYVFSGSGGASVYSTKMLNEIGFFDRSFFAYYEDVDLSFRAQLAGWKVFYEPKAIVYHQIGATSSKIKGFTTYQTMKNLPLLLWKNVPTVILIKMVPRFTLAYIGFIVSAHQRKQLKFALRGIFMSCLLFFPKTLSRYRICKKRKVSVKYINSLLVYDLPPNAYKLRKLRNKCNFLFKY